MLRRVSETHEIRDPRALRALAHPSRLRLLEHLAYAGSATATELAEQVGESPANCSWHLRQLARYGFVEETEAAGGGVGHGRERWWRAVPGDRRFPPRSRQSSEMRLVMDELNHHAYAADLELFEQLQRDAADDPWADGFPYSRGTIRLTLAELREFFEEYIALLNRYKRPEADTPPGARTVLTRFLAFPAQADAPGATQADALDDSGIDAPGGSTPDNRKGTETS